MIRYQGQGVEEMRISKSRRKAEGDINVSSRNEGVAAKSRHRVITDICENTYIHTHDAQGLV